MNHPILYELQQAVRLLLSAHVEHGAGDTVVRSHTQHGSVSMDDVQKSIAAADGGGGAAPAEAEAQGPPPQPVMDNGERLVTAIEAALTHGRHPGVTLWDWVQNIEKQSVSGDSFPWAAKQIRGLRALPRLRSDRVRGRCWVRLALNQGTLTAALALLLEHREIVDAFYGKGSLLSSPELGGLLLMILMPVGGEDLESRRMRLKVERQEAVQVGEIHVFTPLVTFNLDVFLPSDDALADEVDESDIAAMMAAVAPPLAQRQKRARPPRRKQGAAAAATAAAAASHPGRDGCGGSAPGSGGSSGDETASSRSTRTTRSTQLSSVGISPGSRLAFATASPRRASASGGGAGGRADPPRGAHGKEDDEIRQVRQELRAWREQRGQRADRPATAATAPAPAAAAAPAGSRGPGRLQIDEHRPGAAAHAIAETLRRWHLPQAEPTPFRRHLESWRDHLAALDAAGDDDPAGDALSGSRFLLRHRATGLRAGAGRAGLVWSSSALPCSFRLLGTALIADDRLRYVGVAGGGADPADADAAAGGSLVLLEEAGAERWEHGADGLLRVRRGGSCCVLQGSCEGPRGSQALPVSGSELVAAPLPPDVPAAAFAVDLERLPALTEDAEDGAVAVQPPPEVEHPAWGPAPARRPGRQSATPAPSSARSQSPAGAPPAARSQSPAAAAAQPPTPGGAAAQGAAAAASLHGAPAAEAPPPAAPCGGAAEPAEAAAPAGAAPAPGTAPPAAPDPPDSATEQSTPAPSPEPSPGPQPSPGSQPQQGRPQLGHPAATNASFATTGSAGADDRSAAASSAAAAPSPGEADVARHRMQLCVEVFQKHASYKEKEQRIDAQGRRCKGCLRVLQREWSTMHVSYRYDHVRFCFYMGHYYCPGCHDDSLTLPIPARMLCHWDFKPRPICRDAYEYLTSIWPRPVVCVSATAPLLLENCVGLRAGRQVRIQLAILYSIVQGCPGFAELRRRNPGLITQDNEYLVKESELWSLRDLEAMHDAQPRLEAVADPQLSGLGLVNQLKRLRAQLIAHAVQGCPDRCYPVAAQRCEVCDDPEPVFAFDINNAQCCPRCHRVYHRSCYRQQPCPHCFA